VRGLRRGVDHELDLACPLGEDACDTSGIADIDLERAEFGGIAIGERPGGVGRGGVGPKERRSHVVLQANHVIARLHEVPDRLRADETS
jgi:hypothetical protein